MTTAEATPRRLEPFVPLLLEHVDTTYYQRPAALIRLVAELAPDGRPVPLSRSDLARFQERTSRGGKRDHAALCRLADERVLRRWRGIGRVPDAWALNPDVDNWRGVPWITSRADVAAEFRRLCVVPSPVVVDNIAGHSVEVWAGPHDSEALGDEKPLQVGSESGTTTTDQGTTTTERPGEMPPPGDHYDRGPLSDIGPAYCASELRSNSLSSERPEGHDQGQGEREKIDQQHQEATFGRLQGLCFAKTGAGVVGRVRDTLRELASRPDSDRLVETAAGAPANLTPITFVAMLEAAAYHAEPLTTPVPRARRIELGDDGLARWVEDLPPGQKGCENDVHGDPPPRLDAD